MPKWTKMSWITVAVGIILSIPISCLVSICAQEHFLDETFAVNSLFVLISDIDRSRLYGDAPRQVLLDLYSLNITANNHIFCLGTGTFEDVGMDEHYRVLSYVSDTVANNTFVASIEREWHLVGGNRIFLQFRINKFAQINDTQFMASNFIPKKPRTKWVYTTTTVIQARPLERRSILLGFSWAKVSKITTF